MAQATKDELRRERLREYDAALTAARSPVAVLALFARGREARAGGELLEEAFAATAVDGVDVADLLPAAVWVALRQGDVEATIELLMRMSRTEFVLAAHEELDASYRLTKVEERRALPDVELLVAQVAAFLRIPRDVVAIISGWGAEDPRTAAEVETLLEQRFGPAGGGRPGSPVTGPSAVGFKAAGSGAAAPDAGRSAGLRMSSAEFSALLNLAPEQRAVLGTLVRQTEITIAADGQPSGNGPG
ncbi:MAG TPA: hypothetical protein VGB75_03085 [Jatrophihabitans sp.]|jgi:hypothetical protein|uniref:hypothetical protein n=1 Tax=Jatrophihabitans sp. TaxID=1932789 RepID=UPI002F0C7A32